jgi:hypothetical protein
MISFVSSPASIATDKAVPGPGIVDAAPDPIYPAAPIKSP